MAVVVAPWSSSAALAKAVVLPLLLALLVVASATGSSSAELEDGPAAVAQSGGRFSESPVGRKLLDLNLNVSLCGPGPAPVYSCKVYLPLAKNATCCPNPGILGLTTSSCYDVGNNDILKCGSCNTTCTAGKVCCSGVCADLTSDKNNCGICGKKCTGVTGCKWSFCGY